MGGGGSDVGGGAHIWRGDDKNLLPEFQEIVNFSFQSDACPLYFQCSFHHQEIKGAK